MTRYRGLGIVVLSGLMVGCQPKAPPPPQQAPALGYDEIRSDLMSANPGAVVGQVGGTQLDAHLVLIENVDPGLLQLGDAVSFLDDRMNILTIGSVTKMMPDGNIIVRVENAPTGARDPQVGDVAVHIRPGTTLNTAAPAPATMPAMSSPTTMPATAPDMSGPASQPATDMSSPAPAPAPPMTQPELNK